jgi:pilus assembly protein FimV
MKPAPTVAKAPAPAKPTESAKSWYSDYLGDSPYPLYGLGAILLLLGGWLMTRFFSKPKAAVRPQYANDLSGHDADSVVEEDSIDNFAPHAQEQELLDRLAQDPDNVSHSLELLRHYYVQSDATHFEALAEDLHLRLPEDSAEWQEVLAMGEGLLPHHELFALPGAAHDVGATHEHEFTFDAEPEPAPADLQTQRFDFHDLETHAAQIPPAIDAVHGEHARDTGFEFEHEPVAQPHEHAANGTAEPEHEAALDEFLVDEDTIGTRLDLARAYLDMGDPDGARSMLDEVLAEGNETQKEEARKLLSELR